MTSERTARELIVRVRDRGPGLPADIIEQIFEPFVRVDDSRSGKAAASDSA